MSERERWVVYPLLFLALGAALRDKLVDRTITKSIVCQELSIVEESPDGRDSVRVLAKLGHTVATPKVPSAGFLVVNGEALINGAVNVNGTLNAKHYLLPPTLFAPTFQVPPGVSLPDLMRALQAEGDRRRLNQEQGESPPANERPSDTVPESPQGK